MAKKTFAIPVTGGTLTAHNAREAKAIRMFLIDIETSAKIFADTSPLDVDAYSRAVDSLYRRAKQIAGQADTLHWLGVVSDADYYSKGGDDVDNGIACDFQIASICARLAADMREAREA